MQNIVIRFSNISSFFSSLSVCLFIVIALSSYYYDIDANAKTSFKDIRLSFGKHGSSFDDYYTEKADFVISRFDLRADLRHLFKWNTKQLYVYLTAEYSNSNYSKNSIILWDSIIRREKDAKILLRNRRFKYAFTDITPHLKGNNATLSVSWEVVPYIGRFRRTTAKTIHGPVLLENAKPVKRKLVEEKVRQKAQ